MSVRRYWPVLVIPALLSAPVWAQNAQFGVTKQREVQIQGQAVAPPVSAVNDCRFYMAEPSLSLMASCGGQAFAVLVQGPATPTPTVTKTPTPTVTST